jgi:primase-polymerase (primpol)-like protein
MSRQRPDIALANIPSCLKELGQWVVWRYVGRKGKLAKVPFSARGGAEADATDPATWSTFDDAVAAWRANQRWDGFG